MPGLEKQIKSAQRGKGLCRTHGCVYSAGIPGVLEQDEEAGMSPKRR